MNRLLLPIAMIVCLADAMPLSASPLPEYPFVHVTGSAARDLPPDNATVSFIVKTFDADPARNAALQGKIAGAVIAFAEKLGIPAEAIVAEATEKTTVRKEDAKGNDLEIIGYESRRKVHISVPDFTHFGELMDFIYAAENIEDITVRFGRKDAAVIRQTLVTEACADAREQALRLATGFGRKVKQVRGISQSGFDELRTNLGMAPFIRYGGSDAQSAKRDFRSVPATIPFAQGVHAIFELE